MRTFLALFVILAAAVRADDSQPLWNLARANANTHAFSTLFTAHDVKNHLSTNAGIEKAIEWCKQTAITKVYIESFRDGYTAEHSALEQARDRFRKEGFAVSGCVTPTSIGKKSNRWNIIACYTDPATQERTGEIFVMRHSNAHRWWYFPKMTPENVLLLKTYESETDGRARFLGHSAFDDPNTLADAPVRESIEIRTMAFF